MLNHIAGDRLAGAPAGEAGRQAVPRVRRRHAEGYNKTLQCYLGLSISLS